MYIIRFLIVTLFGEFLKYGETKPVKFQMTMTFIFPPMILLLVFLTIAN